jgi:hypothetical protein
MRYFTQVTDILLWVNASQPSYRQVQEHQQTKLYNTERVTHLYNLTSIFRVFVTVALVLQKFYTFSSLCNRFFSYEPHLFYVEPSISFGKLVGVSQGKSYEAVKSPMFSFSW